MISQQSDQAVLNLIWCQVIIEELARFGIEHVCLAPGSRSTPLTLEADSNQKVSIHTHFDERGLAFHALGIAKASNKPVAIIVTSGTAVANLLPAIAESGLTREKLIVLTADRPAELIDCGANQAIEQVGIFSSHVIASLNLPSPSENIPLPWLLTSIDQLMVKQNVDGGSIHINCPFPEPLYSTNDKSIYSEYLSSVGNWLNGTKCYGQYHESHRIPTHCETQLEQCKGLIVIGQVDWPVSQQIVRFAETLGWPVLSDPQSGISSQWKHYDIWLQNVDAKRELGACNLVLQFGSRLISKRLNAFIQEQVTQSKSEYILVSGQIGRQNFNHLPLEHIHTDLSLWISQQQELLEGKQADCFGWADDITRFAREVSYQSKQTHSLSEMSLVAQIDKIAGKHDIFIGNSLIVRLVDMASTLNGNQVYTNRGASGIDGLVATASGIQTLTKEPMLMLVGDTSLLYDLNSLALCSNDVPMLIIVTNNDGGAIFDLLPVSEQKKRSLYTMPHGYKFEHAALQFGLTYKNPDNLDELILAGQQHLASGTGTMLIEVTITSDHAVADIKRLVDVINDYS